MYSHLSNPQSIGDCSGVYRAALRIIVAVLLAAAFLPLFPQPASAQETGDFQPVDCAEFELPSALSQARDAECGYVTAPEEYGIDTGQTIRLGVVILRSRSENPFPYPLFMMQGGPGGSTIHDFPLFLMLNPSLLTSNHDIVLFDQRGTYNALPRLDCPEEMELTMRTLDQDLSDEESIQMSLEALGQCRERLESEGINLSAYDSLENAGDVDTIRRALGYDQVDLYGVSYGTLLALQVMRQYPEGLRTVVLDSVVAPQINDMVDGMQPQVRSIEMVFEACSADPDCSQAYPNLESVFYEQVERLNANPVRVQLTDTDNSKTHDALMDGDSVLYTAIMMMFNTEMIPLVPQMIYDVRAGNYSIAETILSSVTFDRSYSWGMFYSVKCAEEADYSPEEVRDEGIPEQFVPLSETATESFLKTCELWSVEDESADASVVVNSEIPTLILSGNFDPTTPPSYAEEVAKTLPNSYSFLFPSGGHGEVFSFQCAQDIMFAFLNNPATRPDGRCIPDQNPEFVTSRSVVRLPAVMRFLNLQGNAGLELGLYALALLFLLSALLVYPIVWLYRLIRGRPAAAAPAVPAGFPQEYPQAATVVPARPTAWKLAPWLAVLTGILLAAFTIILAVVVITMAVANDVRFLVGVPGTARPLFILPSLAALIVLGMLFLGFSAWIRRWGSIGGRIYFTFLALAAVVCVALLAYWGMVTAIVM